jgi:uncharacterized protein
VRSTRRALEVKANPPTSINWPNNGKRGKMIIDGHAHACGEYLTNESIIKNLDENKADKVMLAPGEKQSSKSYSLPNFAELFPERNMVKVTNVMTHLAVSLTGTIEQIMLGNEYVYELTQKCPQRVLQCVWITTQCGNPGNYLDQKLEEWAFKCVKIHQVWEKTPIESSFFQDVAGWAESNQIPLFIHLSSDAEVSKLIRYKKEHKLLKIIVAHLFGLEQFIREDIKDDNLFFDISSLQYTSTLRVNKAIQHFGSNRVLLGSDTPYGQKNLKLNIERVNSLGIPDSDKQRILGANLMELLSL